MRNALWPDKLAIYPYLSVLSVTGRCALSCKRKFRWQPSNYVKSVVNEFSLQCYLCLREPQLSGELGSLRQRQILRLLEAALQRGELVTRVNGARLADFLGFSVYHPNFSLWFFFDWKEKKYRPRYGKVGLLTEAKRKPRTDWFHLGIVTHIKKSLQLMIFSR